MKSRFTLCLVSLFVFIAPATLGQEKINYKSALFPLDVGNTWTYRVTEKDSKSEQRVTVRVDGLETLEIDAKKVPVARLEIRSGDRKLVEHVAVQADGIYRFSSADKTITPALCFLKLGVMTGHSWQVEATSEGAKLKGTFTIGREAVNVPYLKTEKRDATTSTCRELQIGASKMNVTYWFVDKIGMVKQHVQVGNFDQMLELVEYQPGKGEKAKK